MPKLQKLQKLSKLPILPISEVEIFVNDCIKKLTDFIKMEDDDYIFINRRMIKDSGNESVFNHKIIVCPSEKVCNTPFWNDSEIFQVNNNSLFLYLKGRMLIQTTTTWEVYRNDSLGRLFRLYKLTCNYDVNDDVKDVKELNG